MRAPVIERDPGVGGTQRVYRFDNGYGASVIQTPYSYGGRQGLYELAVVRWESSDAGEDDFGLCYTTPITDDVLGYLSEAEVAATLDKIEELPRV